MSATYVDSSVLLRFVLGEPEPLEGFERLAPVSSALIRVECLRAIERYRLMSAFDDVVVAERRHAVIELLSGFRIVEVTATLIERAADPFPLYVTTVDALHLATAVELRQQVGELRFATHDSKLAAAARSLEFEVVGA